MSKQPETRPDSASDEISLLVDRLRETEQRLQELTGGGVDTAIYPGRQSYLSQGAQEQPRLSEDQFRSIFTASATGIAISTPHGRFLRTNPAYCQMLGYTEDELRTLNFASITHPDDLPLNAKMRDQLLAGERASFVMEKRYIRKNGDILWTLHSVSAVRSPGGEITTLIVVAENITERMLAEARLLRLNRLHTVLSKVGETIVRTRDRQKLYESICRVIVEDGLLRMAFIAEVDAEANVARPVASYGAGLDNPLWQSTRAIPTDRGPSSLGTVGVAVRSGAFDVCNDITAAERMRPWCEATSKSGLLAGASFPLMRNGAIVGVLTLFAGETDYFQDDEIGLMVSVANNLSFALEALERDRERRLAETNLRRNEARFRTMLQGVVAGVVVHGVDSRITAFNANAAKLLGLTEAQLYGRTVYEGWSIVRRDGSPMTEPELPYSRAVSSRQPVHYAVMGVVRPIQNDIVWLLASANPVLTDQGDIAEVIVTFMDVTAQIDAERALEESESRYRALVEWSPESISVQQEGKLVFVNPAAIRMIGARSADDLIGKPIMDFVHPDFRRIVSERIGRATAGDGALTMIEQKLIRLDGVTIDVTVQGTMITYDGKPAIYGSMRDITEQKRIEARFRRLVESNAQSVFFWNTKGEITGSNDAFLRLVGYTREDLESGTMNWAAMTPPEYAERDRRGVRESVDLGSCEAYEKEYIRKDGSRVPILVGSATFEDDPTEGVCFVIDLTERKRVEETLREKLSLLESAQELAKLGTWIAEITPELRLEGSPETYRMHAMPDGAFNHRGDAYLALVDAQDRQKVASAIRRTVKTGALYDMEYRIIRPDGTVRWVHSLGRLEVRDAPRRTRMVGVMQDTTDVRTAQQHLIQAQKMESIGQLTGGIAHDFNNLLGIIRLNIELLQEHLGQSPEAEEMARMALQAAERGAGLTHQLLAYARQQPLEPKTVNIETLLTGMASILARTLGEDIEIQTILPADLWTTTIDPHQLENALLNLAVNALHAMPTGGKLIIEATNKVFDEIHVALNPDVLPGSYVMIAVTDNGTGMSAEVLERVLEPFFTTKPVGKGSGLGLSMVHGFAKQSGGHLKIYSEVGLGTTVNLYLPKASAAAEERTEPRGEETPVSRGGERILLVEDDPFLRGLTLRVLAGLGYRTIEAEDGPSACLIADQLESIDLLLTDVVLPKGMYGPELARRVRRRWPDVKVLYMSGYARDAAFHNGTLDNRPHLISKPFSKAELALMVRKVLDENDDA